MLDHKLARKRFRDRVRTLVVATTGTMTLGATSAGFTRVTGSFLDDGFEDGMELTGLGFNTANNSATTGKIVGPSATSGPITATFLPIVGGLTVQIAAAARSLTVGLPLRGTWHGTQTPVSTLPATRPNFVEQWVPGAPSDDGAIIDVGFYQFTINAIGDTGINAIFGYMQAIRDLFYPGLTFTVNSDLVRVTGRPAPRFTSPATMENTMVTSTFTAPWRVATTNLYGQ